MNICVFGDSITWGDHDTEKGGWVERLKTGFMEEYFHVYNLGVSGENTGDLLKRFAAEAYVREPDVLIFAIGINDAQYVMNKTHTRMPVERFRTNLDELVAQARKVTDKILFVGLTRVDESKTMPVEWDATKFYENDQIVKYDQLLQEVCKKVDVQYVSLEDVFDANDYPDGLHPNAKGHEKIFNKIRSKIAEMS